VLAGLETSNARLLHALFVGRRLANWPPLDQSLRRPVFSRDTHHPMTYNSECDRSSDLAWRWRLTTPRKRRG
jgi:hypothetical protein